MRQAKNQIQSPEQHEQLDRRSWLLGGLIALSFVLLGLAVLRAPSYRHLDQASVASRPGATAKPYSRETLERINQHLQMTDRQVLVNSQRADVENTLSAPGLVGQVERGPLPLEAVDPGLSYDREDKTGRVFRDLHPGAGRVDTPYLPDDRIAAILSQRQWLGEYDRRQTEAYLDALIENAAAAGYELEIDRKTMQVLNWRRKPDSVTALPQPGAGR